MLKSLAPLALLVLIAPPFLTRADALPDAQLLRIMLRGKNLHAGDRARVRIEVKNAGDAPLPRVPVVLMVDGNRYDEWMLPKELPPGEQTTWDTTFSGARGMHLLMATVDPLDDVPEARKTNNSAFINVGVADKSPSFQWVGLAFGVLFFLLGVAAGALLSRPQQVGRRRGGTRPRGRTGPPPTGVRR